MKDVQPIYRTFDELPVMLSIQTVAHVLGISRANAYELAHSKSFPAITIGCRIVVPKDHLLQWIESKQHMSGERTEGERNGGAPSKRGGKHPKTQRRALGGPVHHGP